MMGLVNVNCLLGIAKLDLSSGDCDDANNAEESAQISLGILADNRDSVQLQTTETIGIIKREDSNGKWIRMRDKLLWLNVESIINIIIKNKHSQCVLN